MNNDIDIDDHEKVATLLAETIRESAKLAGGDLAAFVATAERTGDELVEKAEDTARKLRDVIDRFKGRMRVEMKQLAEEVANRSDALAEEASKYIRHCAESREAILEHHRRLNGKAEPATVSELESEMKNLVASSMKDAPPPIPSFIARGPRRDDE